MVQSIQAKGSPELTRIPYFVLRSAYSTCRTTADHHHKPHLGHADEKRIVDDVVGREELDVFAQVARDLNQTTKQHCQQLEARQIAGQLDRCQGIQRPVRCVPIFAVVLMKRETRRLRAGGEITADRQMGQFGVSSWTDSWIAKQMDTGSVGHSPLSMVVAVNRETRRLRAGSERPTKNQKNSIASSWRLDRQLDSQTDGQIQRPVRRAPFSMVVAERNSTSSRRQREA